MTESEVARVLRDAQEYFALGGFWNPEMMDHQKVKALIEKLVSCIIVTQPTPTGTGAPTP